MEPPKVHDRYFKVTELVLTRKDYKSGAFLHRSFFETALDQAELKKEEDRLWWELRYSLEAHLWGRVIKGYTVEYPAGWFEAWKENAYRRGYLGPWAAQRWPVKYEKQELTAHQVFPDFIPNDCFSQTALMCIADLELV
jgi:hypothetical protein